MSEDLIARLKAAHEAARTPGDPSYQLYMAEVEDKLFRENATEIIAALEERELLLKLVNMFLAEAKEALDALEKKK